MTAISGPIVGGQLWAEVMRASSGRCACAGWCGRKHKFDQGRCPDEPTHAMPQKPCTEAEAMTLTADDLIGVCVKCFGGIERQRRKASVFHAQEGALF